jgi:hypothetical protein
MATLTLTNYRIQALNPNGSDSDVFDEITGTGSPSETVDFASMGQRFKMEFEYLCTGNYPNGSDYNVNGLFVRFNPGLFVDRFTTLPPGVMPANGYSFVIPNATPATHLMGLSTQQGQFVISNENWYAQIQVIGSHRFRIIHVFRMIADTENYILSQYIDNQTKLTKNSIFSAQELNNTRPSVYNIVKSYSAVVVTQKGSYAVFAPQASVGFIASFNFQDVFGDFILPFQVKIEKTSSLGTFQNALSAYEDCRVTIEWDDPDEVIVLEKCEVLMTQRNDQANEGNYEKDLRLTHARLVTTGSSAFIQGYIKGPVAYTRAGGKTSVSYIVDHSGIEINRTYDIHGICPYEVGPSELKQLHGIRPVAANDAPNAPEFDFEAEWWTRNAKNGNNLTCAVMERVCNVLTVNYNQYVDTGAEPFTTFAQDFESAHFELVKVSNSEVMYSGVVGKNTATNEILSNAQIETIKDTEAGVYRFIARPFRIPFENEQGLPNFGSNGLTEDNDYVLTWTVRIVASIDQLDIVDYKSECLLNVRPYESQTSEPSYVPKVSNIRFLNPETGLPISAWCDLTEVLVVANVEDLGENTYALAFVDNNPFGAIYLNDFALKEEDTYSHDLPDYVVFPMLETPLIEEFNLNLPSETVSFLLDISGLSLEERMRISVMVYQAND